MINIYYDNKENIQYMYGNPAYGSSSYGSDLQAIAVITIQSIVAQSTTCDQCSTPPCAACDIVCPGGTCPSTIIITVTWANSGGVDGFITPTAITGITTIPSDPINVTVPAGGTVVCIFTVSDLSRGEHDICIDSGIIT